MQRFYHLPACERCWARHTGAEQARQKNWNVAGMFSHDVTGNSPVDDGRSTDKVYSAVTGKCAK